MPAAALLSLLAGLPAAWVRNDWAGLLVPPAEILLLVLLLAALPRPLGRGGVFLLTLPLSFLLAANAEMQAVLGIMGRPGNLLLDLELLPSIFDLLAGNFGDGAAIALFLVVALATTAACLLVAWAVKRCAQVRLPAVASLAGVLALGACYAAPGGAMQLPSGFARSSLEHLQRMAEALGERPQFAALARSDGFAEAPPVALLQGLGGADLYLLFLESYGRTAIESPRYAGATGAALEHLESVAEARGLAVASGWLLSPTIGGQSWLAHGTLVSGLWVDSQLRYDLLLRSDRRLLPSFLTEAGWHSLLVMPQVTKPWPEAGRFGFEETLFQKDLGYGGRPYNWVTMPDQFTLAVVERIARQPRARPLFAQVVLISSHAPWTPIPPVLEDWETIGDGSIFSRWADSGEPPEELWKDQEKVRRQYGLSVDYVLRVLAGFLERQRDRPFLLIALGDHEPAALISGFDSARQVPVHAFASDAELLEPFLAWGFVEGARPAGKGQVHSMREFRDWFLGAFGRPEGPAAGG